MYLDEHVDMEIATKRILWGKLMNSGQTCIAPDYLLCTKSTQDKFLKVADRIIKELYPGNIRTNSDYARIITKRHFQRLCSLMQNQKVAIGGLTDEKDLFIEPTILVDVSVNDDVMKEEIFGPILPIININDMNEAITFINRREKPLALYVFSKNSKVINTFLDKTSSGGTKVTILFLLTFNNILFFRCIY